MNRRNYIIETITKIVGDEIKAGMVLERLEEEGVIHLGYGDADVDKIIEKFKDTYGTTKVTKYDRFSAARLAAKHGSQAVCGVITILGANGTQKYAPVVKSVSDFEDKWVSVLNFIRNLRGDEEIDA